jgi:hypothetical protein
VPLPIIRDILRHTRLATIEGYIVEANMAERFEAVEKLEGLLGSYLA